MLFAPPPPPAFDDEDAFHFDVIYWCSLTAAFRILISGILFANSALLFARVHVKTFHISIFPHSPRKLSSCLSHERRTTSNEKMSSQRAMVCLAARVCSSLLLLSFFFSFVSSAQRNDDDTYSRSCSSRTVHHSRENVSVADGFQHLRQLLGVVARTQKRK
jgi:hypothetical protein